MTTAAAKRTQYETAIKRIRDAIKCIGSTGDRDVAMEEEEKAVAYLIRVEKTLSASVAKFAKADSVVMKASEAMVKKAVKAYLLYAEELKLDAVKVESGDVKSTCFATITRGSSPYVDLVYPDATDKTSSGEAISGFVGFSWARVKIEADKRASNIFIAASERLSRDEAGLHTESGGSRLLVQIEGYDATSFTALNRAFHGKEPGASDLLTEAVSKALVAAQLIKLGVNRPTKKTEGAFAAVEKLAGERLPAGFSITTTEDAVVIDLETSVELECIGRADEMTEEVGAAPKRYMEALAEAAANLKDLVAVSANAGFDHIDYYGGCDHYLVPSYTVKDGELGMTAWESHTTPKGWTYGRSVRLKIDIAVLKKEGQTKLLTALLSAVGSLFTSSIDSTRRGSYSRRW